ncbi:hypothetical protein, partial [Streptomyces sp. PU_AKi4]|uniref:hypothetical protein n=1 Tax=Streptomyces sp. PU_AKi4 TaxID=2800809 RepID=UPI0035241D25
VALPPTAGVLTGGSPVATVPGFLALLLVSAVANPLCEGRPPARRTTTGSVRTVDLTRLTDVRLWTTFSCGGPQRTLIVRDAHGVRLGITTAAGRRAVRRALERRPAGARPRVSRAARAHLDGGGRPAAHTVPVFLAQVTAVCAYVFTLVRIGHAT